MSKYIIGVDVGGTNVKLGLVNPAGAIIARSRLDTKAFNRNKSRLIAALAGAIESLAADNGLKRRDLLGVGIGMPGFINPQKGSFSSCRISPAGITFRSLGSFARNLASRSS